MSLQITDVSLKGIARDRLHEINLTLTKPALVGVIGANGAGKSSLLKVIAGLEKVSQGDVFVAGKQLSDLNSKQRAAVLSYLPQNEQAQWDITVTELLAIGLLQHSLGKQHRRQRLQKWLNYCDLTGLAERRLSTLSGGERQRAFLARALISEPQLLLCDEPTAALDIQHQLQTLTLLKQQSRAGRLVVCSLHDLSLAARYCDRLILIDQGKLLATGSPASVLTDVNLARAFAVSAEWFCHSSGVAWIPQPLSEKD
ncbi:MAG: ABC transporter ATP-binding protein [Pseudomonadota bacterium]